MHKPDPEANQRKPAKLVAWGWGPKSYIPNTYAKYGLNHSDWKKIWERQEGICPGCLGEFAHPFRTEIGRMGLKPEVDHCHVTAKVRGLLCRTCNDLLGKLYDDKARMERLVRYLEEHGGFA